MLCLFVMRRSVTQITRIRIHYLEVKVVATCRKLDTYKRKLKMFMRPIECYRLPSLASAA